MVLRLCQLKTRCAVFAVLLALVSCSSKKSKDFSGDEIMSFFPNKWFSVSREHSLLDQNGAPQPHIFFDTTPDFKEDERLVNVVIVTPKDSNVAYSLDLASGQRFYSHHYCQLRDFWNNHLGSISSPDFSVGYIPRVLDQIGEPQKVIVWSNRKSFGKFAATNYSRVKLVGAYIEQLCPQGNCLGKNNWLSRLVFLAVDAEDAALVALKDVHEFSSQINWDEEKVRLENIEGKNFIGDQAYPYVRTSKLISYEEAFDYFKKRSIIMSDAELKKIQKGCYLLYDALWSEVGKERPEDKPAKTQEDLKAKIKLRSELKKKGQPVGFMERFQAFTKKYYQEISTCERFVYHGNVNRDPEKFWFLSYVGIFFKLHREGYYYDCRQGLWQRNPLNLSGKPVHDLKTDIMQCEAKHIDQAMEFLPNFLLSLKQERDYFRFIDYDNHRYGTHQKLYSWVKIRGHKFECSGDTNRIFLKEVRVFPEDVRWTTKNVKDIVDEMKIIY